MKILILDNQDSFTFNLAHYVDAMGAEVDVIRNDALDLDTVLSYDKVILSPGPGMPADAGCMPELISRFAGQIPLLGVCLGHQAIAEHFGGKLYNLLQVIHGHPTQCIPCASESMFKGLPASFQVGHYHSWAVSKEDFPEELQVTSYNEAGIIMSLCHRSLDMKGLQFHPESILTPEGRKMIENWLNQVIDVH